MIRIVGVAGGSGSGKTTFARLLRERLGEGACSILAQDSYYIDQSARFTGDGESVNFDEPEALDFALLTVHLQALKRGETIQVPRYDFATHQRLAETTELKATRVVLVDGTLILGQPSVLRELDNAIFIETAEELRYERRFNRDLNERGRTPEGIQKQFVRQVKPMHDLHVEPSKKWAQVIIPGDAPFDDALAWWQSLLK
jgi:uridine kinase